MIKISTPISYELPDALEDYLCGLELSNWSIDKENNSNPPELVGYFEKKEDAEKSYAQICEVFEALPKNFKIEEILDSDWQNEYKKYLTSWSCKNLHWVPVWDKPNYKVPEGDKVFYFDAGLAFGTGDHPTTRLCAIRMLDYIESAGGVSNKRLIDAGCGSGILASSAKLLGFGGKEVKRGVASAELAGRLQEIRARGRLYILDGAHNPESFIPLTALLKGKYGALRRTVIYGCLNDKDIKTVLGELEGCAESVVAVQPESYRAMDGQKILSECRAVFGKARLAPSVGDALGVADGDVVVVCGTFTILKEAYEWIEKRQ